MIRIDGWFCASSEPSSETAAYRGVLHSETGSEPSSEPGSETAVRLQEAPRATANERRAAKVFTLFFFKKALPFSPAGNSNLTTEACRALGFLCLGFARVLRALPAHMLCALHTTLVLVTMRLGCDASTLAKRPTSCVAHMHAHVQGCLDIGMCAAYLHRGRATDSRMHARGLFA